MVMRRAATSGWSASKSATPRSRETATSCRFGSTGPKSTPRGASDSVSSCRRETVRVPTVSSPTSFRLRATSGPEVLAAS